MARAWVRPRLSRLRCKENKLKMLIHHAVKNYCNFIFLKAALSAWADGWVVWKAAAAAAWEAAVDNAVAWEAAACDDDSCDDNIPRMVHSRR